jgi:hypothetical protein
MKIRKGLQLYQNLNISENSNNMADDKFKAGVNCASSHSSVQVTSSLMGYEDISIVKQILMFWKSLCHHLHGLCRPKISCSRQTLGVRVRVEVESVGGGKILEQSI